MADRIHKEVSREEAPDPEPAPAPAAPSSATQGAQGLDEVLDGIDDVLEVAANADVSGIIATNTTIGRDGLAEADLSLAKEAGGLSGAPLTRRSRAVVEYVARHTAMPIIGVGGIGSADDGLALVDAGADLVQVYTGYIYRGPALVMELNQALG